MAGSIQTKNRSNDSKNVWVSEMFNTCNLRHLIKKLLGIQPYCGQLQQGSDKVPVTNRGCRKAKTVESFQRDSIRLCSGDGILEKVESPVVSRYIGIPVFAILQWILSRFLESQLTGMSEKVWGFNMEFYIGEQIKFLHWNNLRKPPQSWQMIFWWCEILFVCSSLWL